MHFAGVVPEDAADPRVEARARLRSLWFPVFGLSEQPSIELLEPLSFAEGRDASGLREMATTVTYVLWRNPEDRPDPVNLRELDDFSRAAIEEASAWPRPSWLLEMNAYLPYLWLRECVHTKWTRQPAPDSLPSVLVQHTNHVLRNSFREELSLGSGPVRDRSWMVTERAVQAGATLTVDGVERPAVRVDTDPLVYALGTHISPQVVATVVLPRDALPPVRVGLRAQTSPE